MSCFYPMQAKRLVGTFTKSGKAAVVFMPRGYVHPIANDPNLLSGLPCGQCADCRLSRSRQWAIRMMHEASLHSSNCFITLTFDEESLNIRSNPMSLDKSDFQRFMKRFRKRLWDEHLRSMKLIHFLSRVFLCKKLFMWFAKATFKSPRYYMCGEYGERYKRPHYHAIIFGYDFPDKKLEKIENGLRYYSSEVLRTLWPSGNNIVTDVSFDTCAYVARYIMKKHLGQDAWKHYFEYMDELSGELVGHRLPEYTTMSRRSGIGKEWLDKYLLDVYPKDKVFMRGKGFSKPPKYYDNIFELVNPLGFQSIKQSRIDAATKQFFDTTPDRLHAKQVVKLAQITTLKRNLE